MEHSTSKPLSFLLLVLLFSALMTSHSTRFPNPYHHPNNGVICLNFLFFVGLAQNNICLISVLLLFCLSEHYKNEGGHGEVISRWLVSKRSARESLLTPPSPEANTSPPGDPWDVHAMKGLSENPVANSHHLTSIPFYQFMFHLSLQRYISLMVFPALEIIS